MNEVSEIKVVPAPQHLGREVTTLRLHAGFQVVDYGSVSTVIEFKEKKQNKAVKGSTVSEGILVTFDTKPGQTTDVIIPWGNVIHATLK